MNFIRKLPIRVQLSFIVMSIVIIMVFITLSSYFKIANVISQKNSDYFDEMISQINRTISSNCDVLDRLVQNIAYSKTIQNYLNETNPSKKFAEYDQVKDYILNIANLKNGIIDIALFSHNGTVFNINGNIENINKYINEIPKKTLFYYTDRKTIEINTQDRNCIIVGARIYSTEKYVKGADEIGTLMLVVDANTLAGYKNNSSRQSAAELYMTDRSGHVFFTNDKAVAIGSSLSEAWTLNHKNSKNIVNINGAQYIIRVGDIPELGGRIILKTPQEELLSGVDDVRQQQFLNFSIALILLFIPFMFVINNILQPLKKFMHFMGEIRSGKLKNLKKRINLSGYREINTMANAFNDMLDEVDDLTHRLIDTNTRLYEYELIKRQAEMDYLKSQVNPHFLYNTLESIKGIAVEEGSEKVFNMAKALGKIFRYSIKGADIVELNEELNIIKSYLYIQKIRFGSRLNIDYDFSEIILRCRIHKMLLQPVVENAIYHGIEPKLGEGHLSISGERHGGDLIIQVRDDGAGMDAQTLERLCNRLTEVQGRSEEISTKGIGFENVNSRIKMSYGEEYGISIESSPGIGTVVTLTLPFIGG